MPRDPPVLYLYPLSNYQQGSKGPLMEKDGSVKERMARMAELYQKYGMRRVVEGLLLAHDHNHCHVLLLQIGNTYFKLPGGRLRVGEHETDGLRRKLGNKLGTPNPDSTINWQIGELVSTWWRPNFETVMYPFIPPQVSKPKECRKIFLTQLPPTGIVGVPKNLKLLAVPLFELYDNAHRYGPVIASLPQLLARVKFVFCDHNAQPVINEHINAYQITDIETYKNLKKQRQLMQAKHAQNEANNIINLNTNDGDQDMIDSKHNMIDINNGIANNNNQNLILNNNNRSSSMGGYNNANSVNSNTNNNANLNNLYLQNQLQRQLQFQQLMAAQAQSLLGRMPQSNMNNMRAPNARLIVTNPAMQQQTQSNQQYMGFNNAQTNTLSQPQQPIPMLPPQSQITQQQNPHPYT